MISKIVTPTRKACQGYFFPLLRPTTLCIGGSLLFHALVVGILMRCTWASPPSNNREMSVRILHLEPASAKTPSATPSPPPMDVDVRQGGPPEIDSTRPLFSFEPIPRHLPERPERPALISCPNARTRLRKPSSFPLPQADRPTFLTESGGFQVEKKKGPSFDAELQAAIEQYLRTVRKMIGQNSTYPASARSKGLEGEVIVGVTLNGNGTIQEARVSRTSGNHLLDTAALKAVERSAPFPPSPVSPPVCLRFSIPIVYELKG